MKVHRAVATNALWRKLNHDPRALNAVIRTTILARLMGYRATPCKVGIVQVSLDLFHAWACVGTLNNSYPLRDDIEQQRPLAIVHCGCFEALRLNLLASMPRPQHHVIDLVVEHRVLTLCLIECAEQRKGLIVLLCEDSDGLSLTLVYRRLRSRESGRHYTLAPAITILRPR